MICESRRPLVRPCVLHIQNIGTLSLVRGNHCTTRDFTEWVDCMASFLTVQINQAGTEDQIQRTENIKITWDQKNDHASDLWLSPMVKTFWSSGIYFIGRLDLVF